MKLGNESISFLVRIILDDLNEFLSERERSLGKALCNTLSIWLEYISGASPEEKEIIMNEIHEALSDMSVWEYDPNEQKQIVVRMYQYFSDFYGQEEHIKDFADLFVDYYKQEVKAEFKF
ncbi:hypothetical protein [Paenibacillus sp. FSL H3-0457]|uniref:hypothetical protein n=1 Tax=Paenibacillus sp. FSL H3-0457 TaxID=2921430 RepID=UPI0030EDADA9